MSKLPTEWDLSWWSTVDAYYSYMASWRESAPSGWGRINGFFPRLLGVRPDAVVTLTGIALFLLPFIAGNRITRQPVRYIPGAVVAAILLLAPSLVFGVAFVFQRFTFLALPFLLAILEAPSKPLRSYQHWLRRLGPVLAFFWIALMSYHGAQFDKDMQGFTQIIDHMEPGKRTLSLVFEHDDSHSIAPVFVHFAAWYTALKGGITDPSFAVTQVQPVVYLPRHMPTVRIQGFEWFPQKFDWQYHRGAQYDYFLARAPVDHGAYLFRTATCWVDLVANEGHWWLYRRSENCRTQKGLH